MCPAPLNIIIYTVCNTGNCMGFTLLQACKAEFLFADAIERGCDCVVTCGSAQSNHARVMSIAACELGLDVVLFILTPTSQVSNSLVPMQLNLKLNSDISFVIWEVGGGGGKVHTCM